MKILIIIFILIPYSVIAQAWGIEPAIIIAGNESDELIIIQRGNPLVSVLLLSTKKVVIKYGPIDKAVRTIDIDNLTADILKKLYKKFQCFDINGIDDCKIEGVLGIKKE